MIVYWKLIGKVVNKKAKLPGFVAGVEAGEDEIDGEGAKVLVDVAPGGTAATTERRGPPATAATVTTAEAMTFDWPGKARKEAG